jgi:hypothetical protein
MTLGLQIVWLLVLAVPVACVAWTVTHEELFREPREYFSRRAERDRNPLVRKFFYALTCEYCFSHYVAIGFLAITRFHLLYEDWRGYLIAWFALVWLANIYMGIFGKVKLDVKKERAEIKKIEKETKKAA